MKNTGYIRFWQIVLPLSDIENNESSYTYAT